MATYIYRSKPGFFFFPIPPPKFSNFSPAVSVHLFSFRFSPLPSLIGSTRQTAKRPVRILLDDPNRSSFCCIRVFFSHAGFSQFSQLADGSAYVSRLGAHTVLWFVVASLALAVPFNCFLSSPVIEIFSFLNAPLFSLLANSLPLDPLPFRLVKTPSSNYQRQMPFSESFSWLTAGGYEKEGWLNLSALFFFSTLLLGAMTVKRSRSPFFLSCLCACRFLAA